MAKDYIAEVIDNIRSDRATTKSILTDAMIYLKKNEENHRTVGLTVAKYLETLQRSNEQLVKIASLMEKRGEEHYELSDDDRDELFDLIKEEEKDGEA
jgi:hypothetical protein